MDGDQATKGFSEATLATIPPALQAVVDAGDLSGFVTLIWKDGEIDFSVNRIGVNARLFDDFDLAAVPVRHVNGKDA